MTEFELIDRYLRPLAVGERGALSLQDDAAVLKPPPGRELVVTADTLVEGVHFRPNDAPGDIARKLLRVNLSDLAAKGAAPLGYLLCLALPKPFHEGWIAEFSEGLSGDQEGYGIGLLGGDTVGTPDRVVLSLTAIGHVAPGTAILRAGAKEGDGIYVSGTIGDGHLGLRVLEEPGLADALGPEVAAFLARRYRRPEPRLGLGQVLVGKAHAAADISDGLVADLAHICAASGLGAEIAAAQVPVSSASRVALDLGLAKLADLITGGDDYELVFAAPPGQETFLGAASGLPVRQIGAFLAGHDVRVLDASGAPLDLPRSGYEHGG